MSIAAPDTSSHELQCLEVWGGTRAVDTLLNLPGIDAWVYSTPYQGDESGGDIHYVSSCFCGRVARFVVADVAGHGSKVADLSDKLRKLMRKHINYLDQTGLAQTLNREFAALTRVGRFATALMASYFAPSDHLILCNAGHPRPLWFRAADRSWHILQHQSPLASDAPNNLPLGIIDPTEYVQFAVKLERDDLVLLYTDSLTEAKRNGDGPLLTEAGLLELARGLAVSTPQDTGRALLAAVDAYRAPAPPDDDVTLLVLHHNAGEPPDRPVRHAIRYVADLLGLAGD
jgi:serine phosphatase RsbU (regulator of sigma subunit)